MILRYALFAQAKKDLSLDTSAHAIAARPIAISTEIQHVILGDLT